MAGRPSTGGGLLYGLVAFAILAVAFLGLFIWQFTDNQRLLDEARRAKSRADEVGAPPDYYLSEARARRTSAMNVMTNELGAMARVLVGSEDALPNQILAAAEGVIAKAATDSGGVVNAGDTAMTAIQRLTSELVSMREAAEAGAVRMSELEQELGAKNDQLKMARDEFSAQVVDLSRQLEQIQDSASEQLMRKDEQLAALEARFNASSEELNRTRVEGQQARRLHEIDIAKLENQINTFREQIEQLNPSGFSADDILTKADGQILRAIPGSDIVFVNLGENDGAKPGLTFEVFTPGGARGATGRGKASIEILTAGSSVSECRVTRQTDALIEGDIIVNVAFERNRKPRFVVRGDFDLDHDGQVDWDGRDRIEAIVRRWGGQIVEDVDEATDFLVVGLGPAQPQRAGADNAISRDLIQARLAELDVFRDTIDRAQRLYIPILTQSQFLHLTGFTAFEVTTAAR